MSELVDVLRIERLRQRLSQRAVAVKTGISHDKICQMERGYIVPKPDELMVWMKALGMNGDGKQTDN